MRKCFLFFFNLLLLFSIHAEQKQVTHMVVMVSPDHFAYNAETALTNSFQKAPEKNQIISQKALQEFKDAVHALRESGIKVLVLRSPNQIAPDAVFPNNWFSTYLDDNRRRTLIIYPMLTENRRTEKQTTRLIHELMLAEKPVHEILDLSFYESEGKALEGTGSIVFDHPNKIAYAAISRRTNQEVLNNLAGKINYFPIAFNTSDLNGQPIYHTNVLMSVGKDFAILCSEAFSNQDQLDFVKNKLISNGKEIIEISQQQMNNMCGNIIELENVWGKALILMSRRACNSFTVLQKEILSKFGEFLILDIPTIENIGGGSIRCMVAEVF